MVNFGPLVAEIGLPVWGTLAKQSACIALYYRDTWNMVERKLIFRLWGTPANFNGFRVLAALLHGSQLVGVSQTAVLNRGHHLCSAGLPSRWALAHILVANKIQECGLMLNMMAVLNVGGSLCESSVIPFLVPCCNLWLRPVLECCAVTLPIYENTVLDPE